MRVSTRSERKEEQCVLIFKPSVRIWANFGNQLVIFSVAVCGGQTSQLFPARNKPPDTSKESAKDPASTLQSNGPPLFNFYQYRCELSERVGGRFYSDYKPGDVDHSFANASESKMPRYFQVDDSIELLSLRLFINIILSIIIESLPPRHSRRAFSWLGGLFGLLCLARLPCKLLLPRLPYAYSILKSSGAPSW